MRLTFGRRRSSTDTKKADTKKAGTKKADMNKRDKKKADQRTGLKAVLRYLPFHIAVAAVTWRDIDRRPAERIRGNKRLWKLASGMNTAGSVAYWLLGRK